jgi:hypothetical protein
VAICRYAVSEIVARNVALNFGSTSEPAPRFPAMSAETARMLAPKPRPPGR